MAFEDLNDEQLNDIAKHFSEMGTLRELKGITDGEMDAIYATGVNFYKVGKFDDAEKIFKFLVMFDHTSSRYWTAMGSLRQVQRRFDEAIAAYQYAIFLDIKNPRPLYYLAECYLAKGDKEGCLTALKKLDEHCPKTTETGRNYLAKGAKLKALAAA